MPKNLIFLTRFFPPKTSGIGDYTYYVAKELQKKGYKIHIICNKEPSIKSREGIIVYPILKKWNGREMNQILKITDTIEKPTILLQYNSHGFSKYATPFPLIYLAGRLKFKKHTQFLITFHEVRNRFKWKLKRVLNVVAQKIIVSSLHRLADGSITSNNFYKQLIGKPFSKTNLIRVGSNIPNIDLPLTKVFNTKNNFLLGTFGFYPRNVELLLQVVKKLKTNIPTIQLYLIGKFPNKIKTNIIQKIEQLQLQDHVVLTGYLENKEVLKHLKALDIYLMLEPVHSKEVWTGTSTKSGTLAAAMMAGIPIIGTEGEKTDEVLQQKNIYLIKQLDEKTILQAILKIKNDKTLQEQLAQNALNTYQQHLTWEQIGKQYHNILEITPH